MRESDTPHPGGGKDESPAPSSHTPPGTHDAPPLDMKVEDYLDHVYAPLVGVIPYVRRQELRAEMRGHIAALIDSMRAEGKAPDAAVRESLNRFGSPEDLAQRWIAEAGPSLPVSQRTLLWASVRTALLWFGGFSIPLWLALLNASLIGRGEVIEDLGGLEYLLVFAFPLIAGLGTGLCTPWRRGLGTFIALCLLILASAGVGMALPSDLGWMVISGFSFGHVFFIPTGLEQATANTFIPLILVFYWLPLGLAATAFSGKMRERAERFRRRHAYRQAIAG